MSAYLIQKTRIPKISLVPNYWT